jgi:HlyD family secretion protein
MKKKLIIAAAAVIVVVAILYAILHTGGNDHTLFASGTVEATEAQLGFMAPGRIEQIAVHEGDKVEAGQELAFLDRTEMQARLQQANAQVEATRAILTEMLSGTRSEEIARARAARDAAAERTNDAQRDYERAKQLFNGDAISRQAFDKAQTVYEVAQSQLTQAEEFLRQLERGPRVEQIAAQRANLAQAEANAAAVQTSLNNMTIRAPFDGVVTVRHREPGEVVPAGSPVVTVQNPDDRWVRIFIPEQRVGALHLQTPATISTDTYQNKTYRGEVMFIASEAEFTPKTVQTTEERVRLVYAVKVRITVDETYDLKPGMPADVELELQP